MRFEKNVKEVRELNKWISGDVPDKENSKCKGPTAGASVFHKVSIGRIECAKGEYSDRDRN